MKRSFGKKPEELFLLLESLPNRVQTVLKNTGVISDISFQASYNYTRIQVYSLLIYCISMYV